MRRGSRPAKYGVTFAAHSSALKAFSSAVNCSSTLGGARSATIPPWTTKTRPEIPAAAGEAR